tara:strand:- start:366 stop:749 length:384 start_codon:yes stop_codon:yes gene_type:complete
MDLKDAIKVLDYHQRWRQGIEEDMKYKPLQLTEALDIVLEQVKKNIDDVSNCENPHCEDGTVNCVYKDKKDMTTFVEIENINGVLKLEFSKDCGKFGTDEVLDGYTLTPERLLEILQEYENYTEDEL